MNRLLFAAARGARVEKYDRYYGWGTFPGVLVDTPELFRIHPKDAPLQYGPLSTAIRDAVLFGECDESNIEAANQIIGEVKIAYFSDLVVRQTTALFLAEYLADDGL